MTTATRPGLREFLGALFANAEGLVELRALPSKARAFFAPDNAEGVASFVAAHVKMDNLYVGIATRRDETSGALENCQALSAVFADVDYKMIPEPEARMRLAAFPLPPSLVVASGHGLHCYFLLREPLELPTDTGRARGLLERLAAALGGDRSAAEPARVLRLPGTLNRKDVVPVPVVLELCEPTRRYNPSELAEWLPPLPADANGSERFHVPEEPITPGGRRPFVFRLARSLKVRGLSEAAVLAAARAENTARCRPPLPEEQVAEQVRSAFVQADRPGFEPQGDSGSSAGAPTAVPAGPEWPTLAPEALHGLAGRVVAAIDPHTEADRVATLRDAEGWPMILGRYGTIEWHCDGQACQGCPERGPLLAVWTDRPRLFAKLWAIPGVRRWQTGDREMRALLPVEALEQLAGVIRARRRRPPGSAAHLQKVA